LQLTVLKLDKMVLGQKLGRESSALHVGCALEKGGFAGSAHQVAKQKAFLPSHNWANWKKPAKNRSKKFVKLTHLTCG
jgi:hypothetical protein